MSDQRDKAEQKAIHIIAEAIRRCAADDSPEFVAMEILDELEKQGFRVARRIHLVTDAG